LQNYETDQKIGVFVGGRCMTVLVDESL